MDSDPTIQGEALAYVKSRAPVLFLVLSKDGTVVEVNRFARTLVGRDLTGRKFHEMIVDFTDAFDVADLIRWSASERLLHVATASGSPQSVYFTFKPIVEVILTFGRIDFEAIERMSKEVLSLNRDLNILARQLHKQKIEEYIQKHSEADFSHSICEECAAKYFPDMDIY